MERTGTLYDFAEHETETSFRAYIEELIEDREEPVRALTVISERTPRQIFREHALEEYSVSVEDQDIFTSGHLVREIEGESYEDGSRQFKDNFFIVSHSEEKLYTVFTVSDKDFFDKALTRYIETLPSQITGSFLSSENLRHLIQSFDNRVNGNLVVKKAVLKSTGEDTQIEYHEDKPYYEVFNEASTNDLYVDKIELTVHNTGTAFRFFVSRNGATRYIRGSSDLYFNVLLNSLASFISDKGELFQDRDREYGSRDTDPIKIQYEEGSITGVEENKRLIKALKGIKRTSVTVYHDNPYMHASVLDFDDGTSVDVYLTSDSDISIIPGFNASKKSLSRICDHINKGFLEGEVKAEEEQERDFDDYFSAA